MYEFNEFKGVGEHFIFCGIIAQRRYRDPPRLEYFSFVYDIDDFAFLAIHN